MPEDATPKLPPDFTLNTGAKVIVSYHLRWPDEAPAGLSGKKLSPLEIFYIYAEETNKPKKALGFYARQAQVRLSDARPLDNAAWFDGLRVCAADRPSAVDRRVRQPARQPGDRPQAGRHGSRPRDRGPHDRDQRSRRPGIIHVFCNRLARSCVYISVFF